MKKWLGIFLSILSFPSLASDDVGCAKIGASMYIGLTDAIIEDLNINRNQIIQKNVSVEVLYITPISKAYAEQLAKEDYNHQTTQFLSKHDYSRIFSVR